jgi:hypothetical protein
LKSTTASRTETHRRRFSIQLCLVLPIPFRSVPFRSVPLDQSYSLNRIIRKRIVSIKDFRNHMRLQGSRKWGSCLALFLTLAILAQGAPLRGTREELTTIHEQQQHRRRAMQDKDVTLAPTGPTVSPTLVPTTPAPTDRLPDGTFIAPTQAPVEAPVESPADEEAPVQAPVVGAPVDTPMDAPVESPVSVNLPGDVTAAPTFGLPPNAHRLHPFSLMLKGDLADESVFRRDLELYLVQTMKQDVPELSQISLELAPSSFRRRRRQLQDAMLLQYQGIAEWPEEDIFEELPTAEQVREAQLIALEDTDGLQEFLLESSTQALVILQLQVADFEAIQLQDTEEQDRFVPSNSEKNTGGIITGVLVALVVIGGIVGLFVYREHKKPPPPPPYELEVWSEDGSAENDWEGIHKSPMATTMTMEESEDGASPRSLEEKAPLSKVAIQASEDGMEVVMPHSSKNDPAIADLTRPTTKHSQAVESMIRYAKSSDSDGNSTAGRKTKSSDSDGNSTAGRKTKSSDSDGNSTAGRKTQQSKHKDDDSTFCTLKSVVSNDDDSMSGYSLATSGPYAAKPEAGKSNETEKPQMSTSSRSSRSSLGLLGPSTKTSDDRDSPDRNAQNNPQMRWFEQPRLEHKRSDGFISSDSESNLTLDEVANPLRNSFTGIENKEDYIFDDDEDVDDMTENSEDIYSYKEDDSAKEEESSVMSGISGILSDADSEGVYTTPGETAQPSPLRGTHGPLGYFHRVEDEEEYLDDTFDVLPQVNTSAGDNLSDAPTDERGGREEQDLNGFPDVQAIKKGLAVFSSPPRYASKGNPTSSPALNPNSVPTEGDWEEHPERMDTWVKERRRVKRAARKQRAERKQPPVTMEV